MPDPVLGDLVERLERLTDRQQQLFDDLVDTFGPFVEAAKPPTTVMVCADELRIGDVVVSDRDPDVANEVRRVAWMTKHRTVDVVTAADGWEFHADVPADTCYRVRLPRPEPVWADDPFGTPNTLQCHPSPAPCDGSDLPAHREAVAP